MKELHVKVMSCGRLGWCPATSFLTLVSKEKLVSEKFLHFDIFTWSFKPDYLTPGTPVQPPIFLLQIKADVRLQGYWLR